MKNKLQKFGVFAHNDYIFSVFVRMHYCFFIRLVVLINI